MCPSGVGWTKARLSVWRDPIAEPLTSMEVFTWIQNTLQGTWRGGKVPDTGLETLCVHGSCGHTSPGAQEFISSAWT